MIGVKSHGTIKEQWNNYFCPMNLPAFHDHGMHSDIVSSNTFHESVLVVPLIDYNYVFPINLWASSGTIATIHAWS